VKYLYKYVYKGHDRALAMVQPEAGVLLAAALHLAAGGADGNNVPAARDEFQNYFDGRYVSASEACHRLFAFDLHDMHPNVYRLAVEVGEEAVLIPEDMCCQGDTIDSLVDEVYGDLGRFTDSQSRNEHIIHKAILTPLNEDVDSINTAIMNWFNLTTHDGPPTKCHTYHNADSVVQGEQTGVYPTEFLNSLSMSGVPPHTLTLQEGCPVILLRNMPGGLANGTLLIVVKLM
jgi:hypothetical protein